MSNKTAAETGLMGGDDYDDPENEEATSTTSTTTKPGTTSTTAPTSRALRTTSTTRTATKPSTTTKPTTTSITSTPTKPNTTSTTKTASTTSTTRPTSITSTTSTTPTTPAKNEKEEATTVENAESEENETEKMTEAGATTENFDDATTQDEEERTHKPRPGPKPHPGKTTTGVGGNTKHTKKVGSGGTHRPKPTLFPDRNDTIEDDSGDNFTFTFPPLPSRSHRPGYTRLYPTVAPQKNDNHYVGSSMLFFENGCCIPSWHFFWMIIVLFIFSICTCVYCCTFTGVMRWVFKRRVRRRVEQERNRFKEEEELKRRLDDRVRLAAERMKAIEELKHLTPVETHGPPYNYFANMQHPPAFIINNTPLPAKVEKERQQREGTPMYVPSPAKQSDRQAANKPSQPQDDPKRLSAEKPKDNTEKKDKMTSNEKDRQDTTQPNSPADTLDKTPTNSGLTQDKATYGIGPPVVAAVAHHLAQQGLPQENPQPFDPNNVTMTSQLEVITDGSEAPTPLYSSEAPPTEWVVESEVGEETPTTKTSDRSPKTGGSKERPKRKSKEETTDDEKTEAEDSKRTEKKSKKEVSRGVNRTPAGGVVPAAQKRSSPKKNPTSKRVQNRFFPDSPSPSEASDRGPTTTTATTSSRSQPDSGYTDRLIDIYADENPYWRNATVTEDVERGIPGGNSLPAGNSHPAGKVTPRNQPVAASNALTDLGSPTFTPNESTVHPSSSYGNDNHVMNVYEMRERKERILARERERQRQKGAPPKPSPRQQLWDRLPSLLQSPQDRNVLRSNREKPAATK